MLFLSFVPPAPTSLGGVLQQVRDLGEIDMAAPAQLAAFLQRAFARFPLTTSSSASATAALTRKYALVLWDHGNGWKVCEGVGGGGGLVDGRRCVDCQDCQITGPR